MSDLENMTSEVKPGVTVSVLPKQLKDLAMIGVAPLLGTIDEALSKSSHFDKMTADEIKKLMAAAAPVPVSIGPAEGLLQLIATHGKDAVLDAVAAWLGVPWAMHDNHYWTVWNGGDWPPVPAHTRVAVRFRSGTEHGEDGRYNASAWRWNHHTNGDPSDIVAYRVLP